MSLNAPGMLDTAWPFPQPEASKLPVYDHWTFTTGEAGSFAALVERLQPFDASASAGRRLDASMPAGPDGPVFTDAVLGIDAAMMPEHHEPLEDAPVALVNHLAARLADDTPLAPPLYGRWHARSAPDLPPRTPAWTRTLNLHPSRRVAAGLGAEVVRRHQEEMMAAIWEQAGEIERANQLLRIAQTAKAAAEALFVRRVARIWRARAMARTSARCCGWRRCWTICCCRPPAAPRAPSSDRRACRRWRPAARSAKRCERTDR